jgi:hypothetical protein
MRMRFIHQTKEAFMRELFNLAVAVVVAVILGNVAVALTNLGGVL